MSSETIGVTERPADSRVSRRQSAVNTNLPDSAVVGSILPDRPVGSPAYRSQAGRYDQRTALFHHWRESLVEDLAVRSGDTVLDVGCGTGLCLPLLHNKIGPAGTIIGIDGSDEMVSLAAQRVTAHRFDNVTLIAAPVASAAIGRVADAALFCAVHDIMQSRSSLANVFEHLRPGALVAAIGGKWPAPWMWPLRAWVAELHAPFITDFTGFDQPWQLLAEFAPDLQVRHIAAGTGYLALGHAPATCPNDV